MEMSKFGNLVVIDKGKTCSYALRLMDKNKISRLLVVEKDKIIGIVTYMDIMNALNNPRKRKNLNNARIRVSSAMTKKLVTAKPSSSLREIAGIMIKNKISSVIIEDEDKVNLITKTDLVKKALNSNLPISAVYTKNAISVFPTNTIVSARKVIEKNGIHRLLVIDKEDNALLGIITEKDIAHALKLFRDLTADYSHPDIRLLKVSDFMEKNLKTINRDAKIKDAARIMIENRISGIPVIEDDKEDKKDKKFGIITKTDIVRGIADGLIFVE